MCTAPHCLSWSLLLSVGLTSSHSSGLSVPRSHCRARLSSSQSHKGCEVTCHWCVTGCWNHLALWRISQIRSSMFCSLSFHVHMLTAHRSAVIKVCPLFTIRDLCRHFMTWWPARGQPLAVISWELRWQVFITTLPTELHAYTCWVSVSLLVLQMYYQCRTDDYF